jgi:hypothetical protein
MQPKNYLLIHGRESCKLSIEQVSEITGISVKDYTRMEAGAWSVSFTEAELLGALYKIKPGYIKVLASHLNYWESITGIMDMRDKEIASLTEALKRKITTRIWVQDKPKPQPKPKRENTKPKRERQ